MDASAAPEESGSAPAATPEVAAAPPTSEPDLSENQKSASERVRLGEKLADNKWADRAAKLGYAARGLLYLIAGITMGLAAINLRDPVRGMRGSLDVLMGIPLGRIACWPNCDRDVWLHSPTHCPTHGSANGRTARTDDEIGKAALIFMERTFQHRYRSDRAPIVPLVH
jgi:hypothetical protein